MAFRDSLSQLTGPLPVTALESSGAIPSASLIDNFSAHEALDALAQETVTDERVVAFIIARSTELILDDDVEQANSLNTTALVKYINSNVSNTDSQHQLLTLASCIVLCAKIVGDNDKEILKAILLAYLSNSNKEYFGIYAAHLKHVFMNKLTRDSIIELTTEENVNSLINILNDVCLGSSIDLATKYDSLFLFWCYTFQYKFTKNQVVSSVPLLLQMARNAIKEKVIRLAVACLVNLGTQAYKPLVMNHGGEILKSISERKWSDEELKEDLLNLRTQLDEFTLGFTNWDEYSEELRSGKYRWSPIHHSEEFWLDNWSKFKDNNWKNLKTMVTVFNGNDDVSKGVVCYDLSKLIPLIPELVQVLTKLGTKEIIMKLMSEGNPEVKYEALKCTQLMVAKSI